MLPRIPQCFRTGWTPHQVDPNGRRRRVSKTNGRIVSGNRNSPRSDSTLYTQAKRRCGTCQQDDLRTNPCDPCGHGTPQRTMDGICLRRRPSQELKPYIGTQRDNTLRSTLRRKTRYIPPCCNRHKSICARSQEENAKVGSTQFRRNYGWIRRIPSILNLDPWNKQDQGISGCPFCGRRNKEYGSYWNSGRIQ